MDQQYQLFAPLRSEEYDALKADIRKRGVMVPIELDEHGAILDGHHRAKIAAELGITYPSVVRTFDSEQDKREWVLKVNLLRRHLGPVSWAESFQQLAAERGVELGRRGKQKAKTATVAVLAAELGVPERTVRHRLKVAEQLAPHPELAAKVDAGEMEVKRAQRIIREQAAEERRAEPPKTVSSPLVTITHGDFRETLPANLSDASVDLILTDPPYPGEYAHLFTNLSHVASTLLKPNGVLIALVGQYHLREYMARLDEHLRYRWTGAYLVPGPRNRVHAARVGTGWKPLLVYTRYGAPNDLPWLLDDVVTSSGDDKQHHHWGQNVGPFATLIEALTEPGDLVVDPFVGGGTTAVAAKATDRRFFGCDIDASAVTTATERVR